MESHNIREIFKKNPFLAQHIIKISEKNKDLLSTEILTDISQKYNYHKQTLKNESFDFTSYDNIEKLSDDLDNIIKEQSAKSFLRRNTSNKNRNLITQTTVNHLKNAIDLDISFDDIEVNIIRKIATFKTAQSFNRALLKYIRQRSFSNVESLWKNIEKQNLDVTLLDLNKKKYILAIQVNDYKASKELGSPSWCISYSKSYFNTYTNTRGNSSNDSGIDPVIETLLNKTGTKNKINKKTKNHQVFVYHLDPSVSTNQQLIGFTYSPLFKKKLASHWRNDASCNKSINNYVDISSVLERVSNLSSDINDIYDRGIKRKVFYNTLYSGLILLNFSQGINILKKDLSTLSENQIFEVLNLVAKKQKHSEFFLELINIANKNIFGENLKSFKKTVTDLFSLDGKQLLTSRIADLKKIGSFIDSDAQYFAKMYKGKEIFLDKPKNPTLREKEIVIEYIKNIDFSTPKSVNSTMVSWLSNAYRLKNQKDPDLYNIFMQHDKFNISIFKSSQFLNLLSSISENSDFHNLMGKMTPNKELKLTVLQNRKLSNSLNDISRKHYKNTKTPFLKFINDYDLFLDFLLENELKKLESDVFKALENKETVSNEKIKSYAFNSFLDRNLMNILKKDNTDIISKFGMEKEFSHIMNKKLPGISNAYKIIQAEEKNSKSFKKLKP